MSPRQYLAEHTHLEHVTWVEWLNQQWNVPTTHDHYMMSLIAEVRRIFAKNPRAVKPEDFRLKFVFEYTALNSTSKDGMSDDDKKKQLAAWSKAKWLGMMTADVKEVKG